MPPVPCGQPVVTARRSSLSGYAGYGYCPSHSRWYWGGKLLLMCTCDGTVTGFVLANPKLAGEREAAREMLKRQPASARPGGGRFLAGAGGCTQAEPAAASSPLLCDRMTSGSARPGPSRAACGLEVAGIHRVTAAARPGSARQLPSGTGIVSRDAALRASWAPAIVMTASVRICSSGSPGKLAAGGG
jgi:hypothetical protein